MRGLSWRTYSPRFVVSHSCHGTSWNRDVSLPGLLKRGGLLPPVVGWLLFGELPTRDALLGAAIVTAAGLYNLHREQLRKREEARMDGSG